MSNASQRLATRILGGLIVGTVLGMLALLLGHFSPGFLAICRSFSEQWLDPLGQIFLRLLFFVVIPLIFGSLTLGIVQLERLEKLGSLAARTALFFGLNMAIGVALGLLMMNVLRPGNTLAPEAKARLFRQYGGKAKEAVQVRRRQPSLDFPALVDMFLPRNLAKSVVDFQLLPLILFAILLGAAGTQLAPGYRQTFQEGLTILTQLMTRIVHYALLLAPYAVPAMVFSVIVHVGINILAALLLFVTASIGIMLIHLFGTMSVWLMLFTRRSPVRFFRSIRTVLITAFSTSSSNATLPTSIQVSEEVLGLSPSTAGFVLPLGATMNMSGTALYEGCAVLFIAQIYGVGLSLSQQLTLLILAVFSAVAVAGIPGGSLPLIAGLLLTFGVPPEGLSIIIGVDRLLDMVRTTLNVGADVVTACIVEEQVGRRKENHDP